MTLTCGIGLLAVLGIAPAVPGVADRVKSAITGRRGSPWLLRYADLARLWRKGVVYSNVTTAVFRLAPIAGVATAVLAACLLPLDGSTSPVAFTGDLLAFAGLLALGRFLLALAALDTGSSFEGMGASREVTLGAFAEPALLFCFMVLALATGDFRLEGMLGEPLAWVWHAAAPSLALAGAGIFLVSLAECGRVPVDDPLTHLELTMIHEVMVLDHSGPDLALIEYAGALRMTLFGAIVTRAALAGVAMPPALALIALVAGIALYAALVGLVETLVARFRMDRVPRLLVSAAAIAGFGLILVLR